MIKLNILNMKKFLCTVNECASSVNLLSENGKRENINKQYAIQERLLRQYRQNKNSLKITLDIPLPSDFLKIVSYYAGDC